MTNARPSKRYVNEERVRKRRIEPRRGMRFATTTEVMGDAEDDGVEGLMKGNDNVANNTRAGETIRRTYMRMFWGSGIASRWAMAVVVVALVVAAVRNGDRKNKRDFHLQI